MTPEAKFSRFIMQRVLAGTHAQRIETSTGSGIPDINVCYCGIELWIETKVATPTCRVLLRPFQWAWINRRVKELGRGYVVAEYLDTIRVWAFRDVRVVPHAEYLSVISDAKVFGKRDIVELRQHLFAPHTI